MRFRLTHILARAFVAFALLALIGLGAAHRPVLTAPQATALSFLQANDIAIAWCGTTGDPASPSKPSDCPACTLGGAVLPPAIALAADAQALLSAGVLQPTAQQQPGQIAVHAPFARGPPALSFS